MKTKATALTFVMLIGGFALGYAFSQGRINGPQGMHRMDDGKMMYNMESMNGMGDTMMNMTSRMQGKNGDTLDKVFLEDMIIHHQGAVDMAQILKKGTQRPELKKMADDIISVQTKEIEMMRGWHAQWFK